MLFIYNPIAGTGQIRSSLSYILEAFAATGLEITVHPTRSSKDAQEVMRTRGERYDLVVCCGGDGTLDEVAAGMLEGGFKIPVGYIPAGSTNDFASSLGIPKKLQSAAESIVRGEVYSCDVGRLNDGYFIYVAAFGAFTDVSYKTSQEWKNAIGHLAYLLEGARSLTTIKSWKITYKSSEQSGSGSFLYGMITNSDSVGGFKGITGRDVTLNDGVFEVTLIKDPENLIEWPGIVNALLARTSHPCIVSFKTAHVEFFSEEEVPWTRDGEYGGSFTHAVIENLPRALPLILAEQPEELLPGDSESTKENQG